MAAEQTSRRKPTELEIAVIDLVDNLGNNNNIKDPDTLPSPSNGPELSTNVSTSSASTISSIQTPSSSIRTPPINDSTIALFSQLNTDELCVITEYVLQTDEKFAKFKDLSSNLKQAFIQNQINGEFLIKYSRPEFCKKLPTIKKGISAKLYKKIKSMADSDISDILKQSKPKMNFNNNDSGDSRSNIDQLKIDMAANYSNRSQSATFSEETKEPQTPITPIPKQYIKLPSYLPSISDNKITLNHENIKQFDQNEFMIFVYILLVSHHEFKDNQQVENIINGMNKLKLSSDSFINIKRLEFVRGLKESQVQGAKATKCYKLLHKYLDNDDGGQLFKSLMESVNIENLSLSQQSQSEQSQTQTLSYSEISEIAVTDFQSSARKMLEAMNDSMKENGVNGKSIIPFYNQSKEDLREYLEKNVRRKSVNILIEILWTDYEMDKENRLNIIKEYDRKQLLKYFISLYMNYIQNIVIKHKLDSNKCQSLKRKGLCKIFTSQCGLTLGVATNICDKIFSKIE